MTAGALIAHVDALHPNAFGEEEKLLWLRLLDLQLCGEVYATHEGELPLLELRYTADTELIAPEPYALPLYEAWLCSEIDLHNGEIARYNQSVELVARAWRQLTDAINRTRRPLGVSCLRI
jgi:hypothetical protein